MIKVIKTLTICPICGNSFYRIPCEIKRNRHNYCSRECGLKGRQLSWTESKRQEYRDRMIKWYENPENRKNQSILQTGTHQSEETKRRLSEMRKGELNPFFGKKHDPETCKHMGEKRRGNLHYRNKFPMTDETKQKLRAYRGENTSNWKGGLSPLHDLIRINSKYTEWRTAVFKRDAYKDWFSGIKLQSNIQAHHIIPMSQIIRQYNLKTIDDALQCEALWDINNGVTMMTSSHAAYHQMWGKGDEWKNFNLYLEDN
jgi:hypothetical protein